MPKPLWIAAATGLVAGIVVDATARAMAEANFGEWSLRRALVEGTFSSAIAPLPLLVVAVACARAAHVYGLRSLLAVFPLAVAPDAYWSYLGEGAGLQALANHKWTAATLGPAFAWMFSLVLVGVVTAVVFWVSDRRIRLNSPALAEPRRYRSRESDSDDTEEDDDE
jgi:hypothetical protein